MKVTRQRLRPARWGRGGGWRDTNPSPDSDVPAEAIAGASEAPPSQRRVRRWSKELARLDPILGPEATTWVVLLLVVPILAVWSVLTVARGLDRNVLPWVDYDYWWHLATGEWILDNWRIPTTDPFSWTRPGTDWIAHEWLAEVILAVTVRVGGYAGAISLTAVIVIAGLGCILFAARCYGLSRRAALLLTLLWGGEFIRPGIIVVRPQVWTFALLGALLAVLAAYDTGRRRTLWVLPPLFAFWVNLNLTVLIGIMCLGAFGLDRLIHRRLDRHLVIVGLLCGAALLINPRGPELLMAALKYADSDALRYSLIVEWMSPEFSDRLKWWPFILAMPAALFAAWHLLQLRIWPALPLLVLFYQSFTAVRFIPIYIILAWVFAGWLVLQRAQSTGQPPVATPLVPRKRWALAPPLAATAVALILALVADQTQFQREPLAVGYPEVATNYLLEDYPDARLFNVYDYGGYLIHRFDGANEVYVDGREEMYGDAFLRDYLDLIRGSPGWSDTFDQLGIDAALIRQIDGVDERLEDAPGWELVYADDSSALYVRESADPLTPIAPS